MNKQSKTTRASKEEAKRQRMEREARNRRQIAYVTFPSEHSTIRTKLSLWVPSIQEELSFPVTTFRDNFPFYFPQVGDDVSVELYEGRRGFYVQEVSPVLSHSVTGECIFWDRRKKFGFVRCDGHPADYCDHDNDVCVADQLKKVFVHQSELWEYPSSMKIRKRMFCLEEGDEVCLTLSEQIGQKNPQGRNVRLINATTVPRSRSSSVMSISQSSSRVPSTKSSRESSRRSSIASDSSVGSSTSVKSRITSVSLNGANVAELKDKKDDKSEIASLRSLADSVKSTATSVNSTATFASKRTSTPRRPSTSRRSSISAHSTTSNGSSTSNLSSFSKSTSTSKRSTSNRSSTSNSTSNRKHRVPVRKSFYTHVKGRCVDYKEDENGRKYGFLKCAADDEDDPAIYFNNANFDYEIRKGHHCEFDLVISQNELTHEIISQHAQNLVRDYAADLVQLEKDIEDADREIKDAEFSAQTQSDLKEEKRLIAEAKKKKMQKKDLELELRRLKEDFDIYGTF